MNKSDEKLNLLLNGTQPVPSSPNLAQRIIIEAKVQSKVETQALSEETFLKQFLQSLIFPKPVYALACSMLVGVLLGWQNPEFNMNTIQVTSVDEDLSSLFLAEVSFDE
jgi:hypothetical protein